MMQDWADFLDETLRSGVYKLIPPSYKIEREERAEDDRQPAEVAPARSYSTPPHRQLSHHPAVR
jgi:hypothetical protein